MSRARTFKLTIVMAILALGALGAGTASSAPPPTPAAIECQGVASVSPGLFFPGVGPAQDFDWTLTTGPEDACTVIDANGNEHRAALDVAGQANGWCGQSTADPAIHSPNEGTLTEVNGAWTITLTNVAWESAGSVLAVTFDHDAPNSQGIGSAQVDAFGGDECASSGATEFDVVIVAEAV